MANSPIRLIDPPEKYDFTFVGGEVVCISNPATITLFVLMIVLLLFNSFLLLRKK